MLNKINRTYQIMPPPERAMAWNDYEDIVQNEWETLLNTPDVEEKPIQEFLERHPCLLPWGISYFGSGHNGVFPSALITQPRLSGLSSKIPDFLWLAFDSACVYAILMEIEKPGKQWAIKTGQPHHDYTQAIDQLNDWRTWFSDEVNVAAFKRDYKIPSDFWERCLFKQKYVLIYGRRDDPSLTSEFNKKRSGSTPPDTTVMTFDRLEPNRYLDQCMTVKLDANGYYATEIPPTLEITPTLAKDRRLIRAKDQAVQANQYISQVRKDFLNSRWQYWDDWVQRDGNCTGWVSTTDRE